MVPDTIVAKEVRGKLQTIVPKIDTDIDTDIPDMVANTVPDMVPDTSVAQEVRGKL